MNAPEWRQKVFKLIGKNSENGTEGDPNFVTLINLAKDNVYIVTAELENAVYEMLRNNNFSRQKELEIIIQLYDEAISLVSWVITTHTDLHGKLEELSGDAMGYNNPMTVTVQIISLQIGDIHSRMQHYRANLSNELSMLNKINELTDDTQNSANLAILASNIGIFIGMLALSAGLLSIALSLT